MKMRYRAGLHSGQAGLAESQYMNLSYFYFVKLTSLLRGSDFSRFDQAEIKRLKSLLLAAALF